MLNLILKKEVYLVLLALSILSCANFKDLKNTTIQWHSVSFSLKAENWRIEEKNKNKITFERINHIGKMSPNIELEYGQPPKNEQIDIEALLKQLIEFLKLINDGVQYEAIKIGKVVCYKIDHSISKEDRQMQTIIIPVGRDVIIATVGAEKTDYPIIKKDYDNLIADIVNSISAKE